MKKHFLKSFSVATMLLAAQFGHAATYCGEEITSTNNAHKANITCKSLGNNVYQFIFESQEEFTGYNAAGSNFYMEVNGVGGYQVSKNLVQNGKTLTATVESTVVPNIYAGAFFVNYADGEAQYNIPTDEDFSQTCGGGSGDVDTEKPVMGEASLVSVSHNSAIIAVAATPADKILSYVVRNGETELGAFVANADGQITITGLASGTKYDLTIAAKKISGLVSDNVATVSFTTENMSYCAFPTGHDGNANFGDANGRILLTISKLSATSVRVTVEPNYANGALQKLDYLQVEAEGSVNNVYTAGQDIEDAEGGVDKLSVDVVYTDALPAAMKFVLLWSHPAWPGRWAATISGVDAASLCQETTTLLPVAETAVPARKVIRNGQLVILRDGVEYTILGNPIW